MKPNIPPVAEGPTYAHRILDATRRFASRPALRWKEGGVWRDLSYSELESLILDLAAGFQRLGIARGDRVALWWETSWSWVASDLALQLLGAVTVTIYHTLPTAQALAILSDSGAKALISNQKRLHYLEESFGNSSKKWIEVSVDEGPLGVAWKKLRQEGREARQKEAERFEDLVSLKVKPGDLSAIVYTSGTTGEPKGAMITHANVLSNVDGCIACFQWEEKSVTLLHLPLAHVMARNTTAAFTLLTGGVLALAEPQREKLIRNLSEVAPKFFVTVPYLLDKFMARVLEAFSRNSGLSKALLKRALRMTRERRLAAIAGGTVEKSRLGLEASLLDRMILKRIRKILGGNLRYMVTGGSNSSRETLEFFWGIGIPVYEGYGSTEVTNCASFTWHGGIKLGTVGRAAPNMEIKLAPHGEVLIRGPNVMKGYWNRPEATQEVLDREGWFHSGDIGEMDSQGYLKIVDRKKEIYALATGKKVAPQAVENVLKRCACVASVFAVGDRQRYMTALIVPDLNIIQGHLGLPERPGLHDSKIRDFIQEEVRRSMEELADFERIKKIILLDEPFSVENGLMTPTLKLRRKPILERYPLEIEDLYKDSSLHAISI